MQILTNRSYIFDDRANLAAMSERLDGVVTQLETYEAKVDTLKTDTESSLINLQNNVQSQDERIVTVEAEIAVHEQNHAQNDGGSGDENTDEGGDNGDSGDSSDNSDNGSDSGNTDGDENCF